MLSKREFLLGSSAVATMVAVPVAIATEKFTLSQFTTKILENASEIMYRNDREKYILSLRNRTKDATIFWFNTWKPDGGYEIDLYAFSPIFPQDYVQRFTAKWDGHGCIRNSALWMENKNVV